MTSSRTSMGIDYRCGRYCAARVRQDASGRKVTDLTTGAQSGLRHQGVEGGDVIFSIPDNEVIVKNLHLSQGDRWNFNLCARFELSQSLLDDENEFCFAALSTGHPNRCLGLAARRCTLERLTAPLFSSLNAAALSPKYELRAVALGKGCLNFCHPEPGELICLADFSGDAASICFVLEGGIIGVAYLPTIRFDLDTEPGLEKMAVEFKTVINFRLPSLFEEGAVPPLSALIISGDGLDSPVKPALEQRFRVAVSAPRIDRQLLEGEPAAMEEPLEDYLIAMGLTVN